MNTRSHIPLSDAHMLYTSIPNAEAINKLFFTIMTTDILHCAYTQSFAFLAASYPNWWPSTRVEGKWWANWYMSRGWKGNAETESGSEIDVGENGRLNALQLHSCVVAFFYSFWWLVWRLSRNRFYRKCWITSIDNNAINWNWIICRFRRQNGIAH